MRRLTVNESRRFRDITWLMPSIDLDRVLAFLGIKVAKKSGDEIIAFCPDHVMFVGRESSDPNWHLNILTGATKCWTEDRGSNLLFTTCRLLDCEIDEAVSILTGKENVNLDALAVTSLRNRLNQLVKQTVSEKDEKKVYLDSVLQEINNRPVSERLYQFFIHPPGKQPTNINRQTVDRYMVFERTWGYYSDRAILPFFLRNKLIGFIAIDLLGENEWKVKHPIGGNYRKTLFPQGFSSSNYLFGFDDCVKGESLILVEGQREVMKLWQEGFPNALGLGGKEIHGGQMALLGELAPKEIVIMLDGDEKGREATEKIEIILKDVFTVRKSYPPIGKDPKNLDASGIKSLLKLAKRSRN